MQSLISNLKHQSFLTIILAALAAYAANYIWYYIPFVATIAFNGAPAPAAPPFSVMMWYFINPLLNTVGIAALLERKGAANGFAVGTAVALFFSFTSFLSYYLFVPQLPPLGLTLVSLVGYLLFYALPGTILGHLRKS